MGDVPLRVRALLTATLFALVACADPPTAAHVNDPPGPPGPRISLDSLTARDGSSLPCCAYTDPTSGARITIAAGTMTFYGPAQYTDTAYTPGGPMSAACVNEVANGAHIGIQGLVTDPDGTSYLLIGCSRGTYSVTLTRRLDYANGESATDSVTVSSGTYTWQRNALTLADPTVGVTATMAGAIITVTLPGHQYRFQAIRSE
jgi:hypothetical protein